MSPEINETDVERRLDRLQDDWGDVDVHRGTESVSTDHFERAVEPAREGYTGGGYVCVVRDPDKAAPLSDSMPEGIDEQRRVLLVLGRGGHRWGPAGGGREDDETYEEAAVREVEEETSVECSITGVAGVGRWTTECDDGRDERIHSLYVAFEGKYEGGHVAIQPGELNGAAWWRELPANLHPLAEGFATDWEGGRAGDASPPSADGDGGDGDGAAGEDPRDSEA